MRIAIEKAKEARRTLGVELGQALQASGLDLIVTPLAGRLREAYFGDHVVLSDRLSRAEQRELAAHALGHHLLHAGNQWHHQGRTYTRANYQERQADAFAAYYLIADEDLEAAVAIDPEPHALAERFGLPEPLIRLRLRLHEAMLEAAR